MLNHDGPGEQDGRDQDKAELAAQPALMLVLVVVVIMIVIMVVMLTGRASLSVMVVMMFVRHNYSLLIVFWVQSYAKGFATGLQSYRTKTKQRRYA